MNNSENPTLDQPSGDVSTRVFTSPDIKGLKIRSEALRICRLYVGENWKQLTPDDVCLTRLSGLTNYVFRVSSLKPEPKVSPLLLRIHGSVGHELVIETVTASILAERNFGPKLYGIFPEGRLEEFVEADRLEVTDLRVPEISSKIARNCAKFHKLSVPVMKTQWLLLQTCKEYYSLVGALKPTDQSEIKAKEILEQLDVDKEIEFMKDQLSRSTSPVVFCHNDMQEGNILSRVEDKQLVFIDYEYSCYNYRNFDITNHFLEWMADYEVTEPPFFTFNLNNFPTRDEQMHFLTEYFSEMGMEPGSKVIQEATEEVISEIDLYSCYSHLFFSSWGVCVQYHSTPGSCDIPFGYLEYSSTRLKLYQKAKERLLNSQK